MSRECGWAGEWGSFVEIAILVMVESYEISALAGLGFLLAVRCGKGKCLLMNVLPLSGQSVDHPGRLEALEETRLLDSLPEESFDRFTRLATALLGVKVSLVSLVARDRQFFKSQDGLSEPYRSLRETSISQSFCRHVVEGGQPFVVEDAHVDSRVKGNPAVEDLGVVAYLGMPLATRDGHILGSLCVIEGHPRKWSARDQHNLSDLAGAVMREIELVDRSLALKDSLDAAFSYETQREKELGMLVHDLRTPAGAVLTCLEMLENSEAGRNPEQSELFQLSRECVKQLLEMIQGILVAGPHSSCDARALDAQTVSCSLLLRRAARMIRPFADDAGVILDMGMPDDLVFLRVNEPMVQRVLLNFLTNAVKYSPCGGTVAVRIQAAGSTESPMCRITIRDQGPGVPDEEKARIFGQFEKGSAPSPRGMTSFGIGLAICKSVVEAHGGEIGVNDVAGGGSEFFCELPMVSVEAS
jgi:signal transduction histidine kinase